MDKNKNQRKIQALLSGDKAVTLSLYQEIYPKVKSFIITNNGDSEDAQEIFQDALFQFIVKAKLKKVEIKSSLEGYIFTICKFLWYKELNKRKKQVRNEGVFELKDEDNYHTESIMQQERWGLFEEMFQKLSENCKKLLKDFFDKVSYDIIKKKYNYSTKNVAFQRIFKCKKRLTELIKADSRYNRL